MSFEDCKYSCDDDQVASDKLDVIVVQQDLSRYLRIEFAGVELSQVPRQMRGKR